MLNGRRMRHPTLRTDGVLQVLMGSRRRGAARCARLHNQLNGHSMPIG